jgi:putative iron-regulated protein
VLSPCRKIRSFFCGDNVVFFFLILAACFFGLLGVQCREEPGPRGESKKAVIVIDAEPLERLLIDYADIAYATYSDAAAGARALQAAVERFVAAPSRAGLDAARQAWLAARRPYQQSEVFRFYGGPIDRVELFINTWPIDENYVEGGVGQERLGIVRDTKSYPELSAELLSALNAKDGETSISTGYHVIEFLLWGRDTSADGPGTRPFTDYLVDSNVSAARRARYLLITTDLLSHHLEGVRDDWAPDHGDNYRRGFLALKGSSALSLIIKGMGSLSGPELAGERLTVPYETKAQENEHSCFSDNTQQDLADDARGIRNLCLGRYERVAGTAVAGLGFCDFLALRTPELGKRLKAATLASVSALEAIPPPFDRAILGNDSAPGRIAVRRAIEALERQTSVLTELAAAYDARLTLTNAKARPAK